MAQMVADSRLHPASALNGSEVQNSPHPLRHRWFGDVGAI